MITILYPDLRRQRQPSRVANTFLYWTVTQAFGISMSHTEKRQPFQYHHYVIINLTDYRMGSPTAQLVFKGYWILF